MKQKTDLSVEDLQRSGGLFGTGDSPSNSLLFGHDSVLDSPRGSTDTTRKSMDSGRGNSGRPESERPNLASLGLVNTSSRIGVFTDDDLFGDEQKFASDEHESSSDPDKDDEDAIHEAAPGDLGLAEAISALTVDIDRLIAQSAVVDSLLRKAELTNNAAELRILRKSKASLSREVRRKELQRQQYVLQESDNSLYGRATIRIKSFMVGKESDGKEYALYVVELQRAGGQHMPAASWVVTRRYSEFWDLHQKLREKYRGVRHLDFPRRRVVMKLQNEFLNKRRAGLERYMRELLRMPEVCRDRDLRAFLSQSAIAPNANTDAGKLGNKGDMMTRFLNGVSDGVEDILGNIPALDQLSSAGQNLLNAAQAQLPAAPTTSMHHGLGSEDATAQAEAERELRAFEAQQLDTDGDAEAAEPFVKPIADLFLEIFSLNRGSSASWLRGRAVVVVLHQLLGGTIERKVRDSVKNLTSEDAVLGYIGKLKEGLWPGGVKKEGGVPRGVKEREKTRREAGVMLAMLVPDLVGGVVGRVNAERASRRVFAGLNNGRLK
jgi:sorting nexin-25